MCSSDLMLFTDMAPLGAHIKAGKLRALAQTSARRTAPLPDLPTLSEAGVPGYAADSWYGLLAPAGIPKPLVAKLHADLTGILRAQDLRDRFTALGLEPVGGAPDAFGTYIRQEIAKWAEVVKVSGTRLD